jgi:hypothetical protein
MDMDMDMDIKYTTRRSLAILPVCRRQSYDVEMWFMFEHLML